MSMTKEKTKKRSSRRSVGRPAGDDRDMRGRLLDSAIARFSREGIAATSLRALAADAGVTAAMLHYYFGDKDQLTQALVAERLLPALMPLRESITQGGDDPIRLIGLFVTGVSEVVRQHPWLPPLWVREVLSEGGMLRDVMFNQAIPQLPQLLASRFTAAQKAGTLNAGLDPRLLVVSLVGLTMFPAAGAPIWRRAFAAADLDADALRDHTLALLEGGIGVPKRKRQ
ncbi:MAG: TetR/AcrR family transcriptional regulator [Rudaea sp.]